jgi:hypothetical protein
MASPQVLVNAALMPDALEVLSMLLVLEEALLPLFLPLVLMLPQLE